MLKIMKDDYYAVLGVAPSCCQEDIRFAYISLSRKWHPDKLVNRLRDNATPDHSVDESFVRIHTAYEILGDARSRRKYDEYLASQSLESKRSLLWKEVDVSDMDYSSSNKPSSEDCNNDEVDQDSGMYTMSCRCGGEYIVAESILIEVGESGGKDVDVSCSGCSSII